MLPEWFNNVVGPIMLCVLLMVAIVFTAAMAICLIKDFRDETKEKRDRDV